MTATESRNPAPADPEPLELLLFTHDASYASTALQGGMDAIVVDWEWHGKSGRQAGRDTEINCGTEADLARMRAAIGSGKLICRINNCDKVREDEIERAIRHGADEIWLPMVRDLATVAATLRQLAGRARLGVQVETADALSLGPALQALDLARVYIGLNDLHIDLQL
ncbi:MAG: aldolase/citrate lyase family protein, partial [Panacagrimonas sp.]